MSAQTSKSACLRYSVVQRGVVIYDGNVENMEQNHVHISLTVSTVFYVFCNTLRFIHLDIARRASSTLSIGLRPIGTLSIHPVSID